MKIKTEYLGRVEGEAGVRFEIKEGRLKNLKINVWEPPRFFEGMLVGRRYDEVPDIVARICGICPVSHMLASIRAIEKAIGFEPAPEVRTARKIMAYSQIASSHLVHLVMLALPDYRGKNSFMELLSEKGKNSLLKKFITLKNALNNITRAFGGRALHPVSMVAGGFTAAPEKKKVDGLLYGLASAQGVLEDIAGTISAFRLPRFETGSELVSLSDEGGYAINAGRIVSDMGLTGVEDEYEGLFCEEEAAYSNAKKTRLRKKGQMMGGQIMTGALARVSLQHRWLGDEARKLAYGAGLLVYGAAKIPKNLFHNITAQTVELLHFTDECRKLLESADLKDLYQKPAAGEGEGRALTEAPRGLLYHSYTIDARGVVRKANIVTPTAHNYLAMEQDLKKLIEENMDLPGERLELLAGMLIRAYDPCFSCSVH